MSKEATRLQVAKPELAPHLDPHYSRVFLLFRIPFLLNTQQDVVESTLYTAFVAQGEDELLAGFLTRVSRPIEEALQQNETARHFLLLALVAQEGGRGRGGLQRANRSHTEPTVDT